MVGLREKKKKESEARIVNAARDIFLTKGYTNTTMEEIAENAEIGVGTLYNYFKSKAEIFVSIMSEELFINNEDSEQLEYDLENEAAEVVIAYLWKFMKNMKPFGKRIWRELFAAVFGSTKIDSLMFKGLVRFDFMFIEKLERILESLKQKGMLPQGFKSKEASYTIYSVVLTQTMLYIYMEEINFEEIAESIESQIRFFFEGKCLNQECGERH